MPKISKKFAQCGVIEIDLVETKISNKSAPERRIGIAERTYVLKIKPDIRELFTFVCSCAAAANHNNDHVISMPDCSMNFKYSTVEHSVPTIKLLSLFSFALYKRRRYFAFDVEKKTMKCMNVKYMHQTIPCTFQQIRMCVIAEAAAAAGGGGARFPDVDYHRR